ncbi:UNVERIFIED_ORG: hypothetical protein JN05_03531 [Zoogloea ramigera]
MSQAKWLGRSLPSPSLNMKNQCCATSDLSFLPVEQRGKLHESCARLLKPGGGASAERRLRIGCASGTTSIRKSILGLGQCPGVVGHVPDNVALTIEVGLLFGAQISRRWMDQQQPRAVQHQVAGSQTWQGFMPLDLERRTHVDTACAAYHLGRKPQTLRVWASAENGPLRPVRVNGRLAWPVEGIRRVLGA